MVESCGYEGCRPMVDFLSSNDIRIRIEALNHRIEKIFAIDVWFLGKDFYTLRSPQVDEYEFEPSAVTARLKSGIVLKPKPFTCSYTKWDKQYLQSAPAIKGTVPLKKNDCFRLFFDYPPPSVEEDFTMELNGLKKLGQPVSIPTIYFRKAISRW